MATIGWSLSLIRGQSMRTNFSAADTEGDVENFFVLPLLTDVAFCGIPEVALRSKQSLATYEIDKGRTRKRYVPDYVVYAEGLPVCVVEVKRPDERLDDAYAEAQLYAHELNKKITGADPAFYVMATNGGELWVGYWNVDSPAVKIDASDLLPGSRNLDALQRMIAWDRLQEHSTKHASQVLPAEWMLPSEWLGENRVTLAKAGHNSLYSDLDPILRRYFNPKDTELEEKIIQYAYVPTGDVTKYERSFEDFLRTRIIPLADAEGTEIETTKRASPNFQARLEDAFRKRRPFMQLVIGGVGSGKQAF